MLQGMRGGGRSDTSNLAQLRIWWKTYEMRGRGIFISAELVLLRASVQEVCAVIPLWRGSLQRGPARSQRTPWEEREDHAEEQDGTLLNQHSAAERDHNQAFAQGPHNYLPNKGHFYITPTTCMGGKMDCS